MNGGDIEEGWHDLTGDASVAEIKRDDQTGNLFAGDPLPSAAVGGGKPRRERGGGCIREEEAFLELEKVKTLGVGGESTGRGPEPQEEGKANEEEGDGVTVIAHHC